MAEKKKHNKTWESDIETQTSRGRRAYQNQRWRTEPATRAEQNQLPRSDKRWASGQE